MKTRQFWAVVSLAIAGCTPSDPELTRESVDLLKAQNTELTQTISDLEIDISEQDSYLANYTTRMVEILEQISSVEKDELRIQDLTSDLATAPYRERDWISEIGAEIDRIETALRANEARAEQIRNELSSERELNDELKTLLNSHKTIIAQQNTKLARLREEFKQLKEDFLVLTQENTGLGIQVRVGESRIADLVRQVSELSEKLTVFVLAGTAEDLRRFRRDAIIKSRFGRLEPHPEGLSEGRVKRSFQPVDPNHETLTVPGNMTELHLRSIHGKHTELYSVIAVEHGMQLLIKNPEAFWGLSRFLILEAR